MKTALQILLLVVIIVLGYFLFESIQKPIRFKREVQAREALTIDRLKDIRTAQVAYKDVHGKFTGSFDTLIHFIRHDSFTIVSKELLPGWDPDKFSEKDGIRLGFINISETKKPVKDSLFHAEYPFDRLRFIPFTNGKEFTMGTANVTTGSNVVVNVFEVNALFKDLLNGLDEQLVINYVYDREKVTHFPGLRVGSLTEATNNAGNWEK